MRRRPRFYPLLAYHWSRTDMAAKAVQYQGLAGEQALAGGAYQEAVLFLTAALERSLRHPRTATPRPDSGGPAGNASSPRPILGSATPARDACTSAGRWNCSEQPCPPHLANSPPACCSNSPSRRYTVSFRTGPWAGDGGPEDSLEASRAYMRLTEVFWFANNVPSLVHAGIQALNLAERAGPSPELARAYSIMCLAAGSIPIHPLARAYARRAEQTARHTGQLWPLGDVRFITCVYKIGAARWAELHEALEEAEGLLEQAGDRGRSAMP